MYNLIEYSDNYSKTSCILWQYYKDEPTLNDADAIDNYSGNSASFKGELRPKLHLCFYVRFLLIVWRKDFVQNFVAIRFSIRFCEVIKLQSFEFRVCDVTPANV